MRDDCPVSRNCIVKQAAVLRLAEARGHSIALLSAETQIPEPTLRSYIDKPSRPASLMSFAVVVKLLRALPADLAQLLLEDSGYQLVPAQCSEKDWPGLAKRASDLSSMVLDALSSGGRIDHREDAKLTDAARELAAEAEAMTAGALP
jgi:hypothetical protein